MSAKINHVIGLMSGTSLDGIDLLYVKFDVDKVYSFEILNAETVSYSAVWLEKLRGAFNQSKEELAELDIEYGQFLGETINTFIKENKIENIDFIASHGHTIFHKPEEGYTLQIGDGQTIANVTNQQVICDFRTQDVEFGGEGAPLVPIGDRLLFGNYDYCLNLGGFANISFEEDGKRIAYDVCPVNIVLNHYAQKRGLEYDKKGQIASTGYPDDDLLKALNKLPFYKQKPPKSLGLEWVEEHIFPLIDSYNLEINDILRTFVEHIAMQISKQIPDFDKTVFITGGGVFNQFLALRISRVTIGKIEIPRKDIVNFKEALIFALLGLLKSQEKVNVLKSVTGASKDHSSGKIFNPKP